MAYVTKHYYLFQVFFSVIVNPCYGGDSGASSSCYGRDGEGMIVQQRLLDINMIEIDS